MTSDAPASTTSDAGTPVGLLVAGVALIATCYGFARFTYGLFSLTFQQEFALSAALSGVIGSGGYVGYCVAIAVSSTLTRWWGPRRVAVLAGVVATTGMIVVAAAPSALLLAAGLVIAGSSTGIASPPLAAAIARWVHPPAQDRAQILVNSGTGVGVLVSGPIALVLLDHWRWAWAVFALGTALVTWRVHVTVPSGPGLTDNDQALSRGQAPRPAAAATAALMIASFVMGLSSIAVWTLGRELIDIEGDASALLGSVMWTLIGAAGIAGALGGPMVHRVGIQAAWAILLLTLGAATAGLALAPSRTWVVATAAVAFGASYIAVTGVALVWATRLYPGRAALGVGASFFMIAAGQAIGAPLVGIGADHLGLSTVFYACAALALTGTTIPRIGFTSRPKGAG